ncbi:MAG: site-specific integrase [Prevotellaceae bacterium]|jgi:site-specific recombinase XerD|nr:site-specific integrase [Prevotellaceae bacterium]
MRSTFKILFYLKRDKQKANGQIPLFCRITVDGQEARFGMKCDINPKYWDVKTGKASGRTQEAVKINALVDNTKSAIYKVYRELQERDNYVTAERVKNVFLGAETRQQTLLELFDKHNTERERQIGVNLCQKTYGFYCLTRARLADFISLWYKISDIPLKMIDYKFVNDFETYLVTNYQLVHNTLIKYMKSLRHIIRIAMDEELITKNPFANRSMQYQNSDRGYLTQAEIDKLITFRFDKIEYEQARDIFIFCCFTGLSYSDAFKLNNDNIRLSFDGKMWIKGKREKTDIEYNIPLLDIAKTILEKYKSSQTGDKLLPLCSLGKYNNWLKKISAICGINKNITSHIARHTFATFTLTKGVSIESVSKMLGHVNIKTTQIYAKITNEKISNDMALFAEKVQELETRFAESF